jgi:hypothetical protein
MVIDFGHHYIPAELGRLTWTRRSRQNARRDGAFITVRHGSGAATWIASASASPYKLHSRLGHDAGELPDANITRSCNEIIKTFRQPGYAPVLGTNPDCRLDRAISELGLKGVTISSQVDRLSSTPTCSHRFTMMNRLAYLHASRIIAQGYSLMQDHAAGDSHVSSISAWR